MRRVDENDMTAELRDLLIKVAGPQWKTVELTEGLLLNLDSLQTIDLFVSVQDRFGLDLFRLAAPPETFGALLDAVVNYDENDKNSKPELDLSQFPQPVAPAEKVIFGGVQKFAKALYRVKGYGQENLPKEGNFILCSNHITVLDPGWIMSCLPSELRDRTAIVGKSELIDDKLLKNFVRSCNIIPVDRTGNSLATLDRCRELICEGWNILIFPEGTNYESAKTMLPFKNGPAKLAIATGRSIVPVHIAGLADVDMEHKGFLPPTGGKITVRFGAPVSSNGHDPASLNAELRAAIEALAAEEE